MIVHENTREKSLQVQWHKEQFDEKANCLENMHIYDLRELARNVGVRSPTTLRKADIILAICQIEQGILQPHKPKVGRKPKKRIAKREYISKENIEVLRQRNLSLIDENQKLTDTLALIHKIMQDALKTN